MNAKAIAQDDLIRVVGEAGRVPGWNFRDNGIQVFCFGSLVSWPTAKMCICHPRGIRC
jgi:hypothetical protein